MTAVRPGSRTDDIGVPAMDARLAGCSRMRMARSPP